MRHLLLNDLRTLTPRKRKRLTVSDGSFRECKSQTKASYHSFTIYRVNEDDLREVGPASGSITPNYKPFGGRGRQNLRYGAPSFSVMSLGRQTPHIITIGIIGFWRPHHRPRSTRRKLCRTNRSGRNAAAAVFHCCHIICGEKERRRQQRPNK